MGNADGYYLADGDSDPAIAVDFRPYLVNFKESGRAILEESGADLSPKALIDDSNSEWPEGTSFESISIASKSLQFPRKSAQGLNGIVI